MDELNEQKQNLRKRHLTEVFAFIIILLLGASVFYFAKSPGRKIEFLPQAQQSQPVTEVLKPAETPRETFIAQEDLKISYGNEKVSALETEKLPSAGKFKTFSYNPKIGKVIEVAGTCSDFYYAIIVFKSTDDYKTNPAMAKINNAFECPASNIFKTSFNLGEFNLTTGNYYFFVADQGKTGIWYNPR